MRLRRSLAGLPVLLVLAAILAGTVPVDGATRKVTLGVTVEDPDPRDEATFDAFADRLDGIKPRIWTLFSKWGDLATREFPRTEADWIRSKGAVPMIFWEPYRNENSCDFAEFSDVTSGSRDQYIRRWAQEANEYGGTLLLRYAHEINGKFFPWGLRNKDCDNTAAEFKAAWRHVFTIFQEEDATNVKFLWTVAQSKCKARGCNPYRAIFPGNAYVHYVGFSAFNWGTHSGHRWVSMRSLVGNVMGYFKQFTSKPVIVAEVATNKSGGNKPAWIRDGYDQVYSRYPKIKAIVYLNVDLRYLGHPDWSLGTPSGAYPAYERVAAKAKFQGQL